MTYDRLPPERQLRLYLGIARKLRKMGPGAAGPRRAAVRQAWRARREMHAAMIAEARAFVRELQAHAEADDAEA